MTLHVNKPLSVSQIAKYCQVSVTGLKQVFMEHIGMSVHKFFLHQKLIAAIKLLEAGVSITDAATNLGFSSQSYFSVVFKREIGVAPSDYVKSLKSETNET